MIAHRTAKRPAPIGWLAVGALSAAASITCCGPNDSPPPQPTESECSSGGALTYDSFGRDFFDRYCASCHAASVTGVARMGAPRTVTFDDVEMIRDRLDEIDELAAAGPAAENRDMPRGSGPRPRLDERYALGEWLACGAP